MFLKDRANQINTFLILLFLTILFILKFEKIVNRESEKCDWDFYVFSNATPSPKIITDINSFKQNKIEYTVQIISAQLYNTSGDFGNQLDNSYKNEIINNDFQFSSTALDIEYLLADTIKIEYYSFDENKFYQLTGSLPYEEIINIAYKMSTDNNLEDLAFAIDILPKGKVAVYFGKMFDSKLKNVAILTAKEINYDWKKLKSFRPYFNESIENSEKDNLKDIEKLQDYIDLVKKKYKWSLIINLPKEKVLKEIDINSFDNKRVSTEVNSNTYKLQLEDRIIPDHIYLYFGKGKHPVEYSFDGYEILSAFKKLKSINNSKTVEIIYDQKNNKLNHFILKKGDVIIPLRDIYK